MTDVSDCRVTGTARTAERERLENPPGVVVPATF